jgi:putative sterol carrier protein
MNEGGSVAKFLSHEFMDLQKTLGEGQPERAGASARMQYVVTGSPEGDVRYYWVLENGKLLDAALGDLVDAEVTMTQSYEDAVMIAKGELDANVAFMQGRIKVAGNMAALMALMPLANVPEFKQLQIDLLARTEF